VNKLPSIAKWFTLSCAAGLSFLGLASDSPAAGAARWTEANAKEWHAKQPWLFGFNFVPSTAVNDTEIWQAESFDPKTMDREST